MIKKLFMPGMVIKIFNEIKDGDCGVDILRKTSFANASVYISLTYLKSIGLIERKAVTVRQGRKKIIGRRKRIFLTKKGIRVRELLNELKILTGERSL